jgi:hypothetical protein
MPEETNSLFRPSKAHRATLVVHVSAISPPPRLKPFSRSHSIRLDEQFFATCGVPRPFLQDHTQKAPYSSSFLETENISNSALTTLNF